MSLMGKIKVEFFKKKNLTESAGKHELKIFSQKKTCYKKGIVLKPLGMKDSNKNNLNKYLTTHGNLTSWYYYSIAVGNGQKLYFRIGTNLESL